jgi:hypothetical protein
VASTETSSLFNVTLMNPDPMNLWSDDYVDGDTKGTNHLAHEDVEFIRLQFRRPGTGEWISAWEAGTTDSADLQCSEARGEGCSFEWDLENQYFLNGLKDGPWEIRAKVFCSGYDSFATTDVRGSVTDDTLYMIADVTNPYPLSHGVYGNVLLVDFSEEIACPQLDSDASAYSIERTADCDGNAVADGTVSSADILLHYAFRCLTDETNGRNAWTMTIPVSSAEAEAGEYAVTINKGYLADTGGNGATSFTITESFGCSSSSSSSSSTSTTSTTSAKLGSSKGTKDASFLSPLNKNTAYYIVVAAAFAFGMVASQMMASFTRESNRFVHKEYHESAPTAAEECLVPLRNATHDEFSAANAAYGSSEDGVVVGAVL